MKLNIIIILLFSAVTIKSYSQDTLKTILKITITDNKRKPIFYCPIEVMPSGSEKIELKADSLGVINIDLYCQKRYIIRTSHPKFLEKIIFIESPCDKRINKKVRFKLKSNRVSHKWKGK